MSETRFRRMNDLPSTHLLGGGTAMCAGCGGLQAIQEIYDVLGPRTIFVNAAGCMTLLSIYPFTPFRGSWLYTAMACAPAGSQGVRDALDILVRKGRIEPAEDLSVVTLAGDGASYGMGLSATSAAIDRGLDFLYVCYDNEGYGNTGQQTSAATPFAAVTATNDPPLGNPLAKKDLFAIWAANRPTYVATAIAAEPVDLARKIEKASAMKGPRLLLILAPCPTGWGFEPSDLVEIGRLAVSTGVFPLKEWEAGRTVHTKIRRPRVPVEEYLKRQGRFRHLFKPERQEAVLSEIQRRADAYWSAVE
ncbi:MAG TPA: thiamine pyrophosphate-dependent enzyme [Myxococcota bacterium]|nr:thiamine pyrophosphate-dependent enzyme [Myxococcota bacterium]